MVKPTFTRVSLSNVKVVMAIMRVSYGGVSMSGGDGMDSTTKVPTIKYMWALVAMAHCVRL
jgi:uncharacterized radical SAM superfamily protein